MSSDQRGGGGFGAGFVPLVVVGAIAKFIWWLIAGLGVAVALGLFFYLVHRSDKRRAAALERIAAIIARADEQHAQLLAGDDRGLYGIYPAAVPPEAPPIPERLPVAGENWTDYLAEQRRKALAS